MPYKRIIAAVLSLFVAGCTFGPPPPDTLEVYEGAKRPPSQVARIANSEAAVLILVDQRPIRGISWKPGTLRSQITYELLPGTHRLRIARAIGEGSSARRGQVCDILVDLVPGRDYRFVTQTRTIDGKIEWECRVADSLTGSTVGKIVDLDPPLPKLDPTLPTSE